MPLIRLKEKPLMIGIVTLRSHPAGTIDKINALRSVGAYRLADYFLRHGKIESRKRNMVVYSANCGFDVLVQFLCSGFNGSFPFTLGPQWGEIGAGQTAPASTDIALTAPSVRMPISWAADYIFATAQLQFFFPDGVLANQTYYEFGTFLNGSSTIGTGNMFNHALFASPYAKVAGQDTTVEVDFPFGNGTGAGFDQGQFS